MTKEKTIMQALTEVVPNYLASYLCWYYSDPNKRISWDELCKSDANFRSKSGENKTEDFAEQNWLIRDDVQKAMIIYLSLSWFLLRVISIWEVLRGYCALIEICR